MRKAKKQAGISTRHKLYVKAKSKNSGITLIALVVTIVILLILAGITIGILTGENGLIKQSQNAKIQTEIAEEKEVLNTATIKAMAKDKFGNLLKENLQEELARIVGEGRIEVADTEDSIEVCFLESKRYYEVDKDGNVGNYQKIVEDKYPGDITKDENGNNLDGSPVNPYEINCIEDLVAFSNMVNGIGYKMENGQMVKIEKAKSFYDEYVILKRALNFKSAFSYMDSKRTDFGDINGNDSDGNELITEMTTGQGFVPIGQGTRFQGNFNGQNYKISNLYENNQTDVGLFGVVCDGIIKNVVISGNVILTTGKAPQESSYGYAGGIVGRCSGSSVIDCTNYVNVKSDGNSGGICGGKIYANNHVYIINCHNYGKIESSSYTAGGIIGYTWNSCNMSLEITNCCNKGEVNGKNSAGGIVGDITDTLHISNSYNWGRIISETGIAGGIGGKISVNINSINNYNTGIIQGKTKGGIIGSKGYGSTNIINCYYLSNVNLGVGNDSSISVINKDEKYLKSQEFVVLLNQYIDDNRR